MERWGPLSSSYTVFLRRVSITTASLSNTLEFQDF